ncbi:MAG: hypothetical protein H0U28_04485 [Nocardioidaceae bacterium]|nr:hypothetical protein [Nocardioidaceae bacterium]
MAVERWGEVEFVDRCVRLLQTMSWGDEPELLSYLGGTRGPGFVERGLGREGYWLRVWPLRAMLYASEVGEAEQAARLRTLLTDENSQVSAQADRALLRLAERTDRDPQQLGD